MQVIQIVSFDAKGNVWHIVEVKPTGRWEKRLFRAEMRRIARMQEIARYEINVMPATW